MSYHPELLRTNGVPGLSIEDGTFRFLHNLFLQERDENVSADI